MTDYPEAVYRALELAERCTLKSEIPRELKEAVRFCIAKGMAWIQPAVVAGHFPGDFNPTVIINPKPKDGKVTPLGKELMDTVRNRLLIKEEGRAALALHRLTQHQPRPESKPQLTPADDPYLPFESVPQAAKRFKVSANTVKRWIKAGKVRCEWAQGKRPKLRLLREDVLAHGGKVD